MLRAESMSPPVTALPHLSGTSLGNSRFVSSEQIEHFGSESESERFDSRPAGKPDPPSTQAPKI